MIFIQTFSELLLTDNLRVQFAPTHVL